MAKACEDVGKIVHVSGWTAVQILVRAGVAEQNAMQLTGQKTRAVFDRYDAVNEADLRDGAATLNPLLGRTSGTMGRLGTVRPLRRSRYGLIPRMPGWRNWQTHGT